MPQRGKYDSYYSQAPASYAYGREDDEYGGGRKESNYDSRYMDDERSRYYDEQDRLGRDSRDDRGRNVYHPARYAEHEDDPYHDYAVRPGNSSPPQNYGDYDGGGAAFNNRGYPSQQPAGNFYDPFAVRSSPPPPAVVAQSDIRGNGRYAHSQPDEQRSLPEYDANLRGGMAPGGGNMIFKEGKGGFGPDDGDEGYGAKKVPARPNFEDTLDMPEGKQDDARKKRQGCMPRSGKGRLICLLVFLILVAGLGVFGFFFWPRFPQIGVLGIRTSDLARGTFEFSLPPDANGNWNRVNITMRLKMNISCFNENLYDLKVESINLQANVEVNATAVNQARRPRDMIPQSIIGAPPARDPNYKPSGSRPIGVGSQSLIVFPAKKNKTFEMDFAINYTPDSQLGLLEDPTFVEFMNSCGVTQPQGRQRPTRISYSAVTTVSFLRFFGYRPEITSQIFINCPVDTDTIVALSSASQSGNGSLTEVIQQVFGTSVAGGTGAKASVAVGMGATTGFGLGSPVLKLPLNIPAVQPYR
ncbi:hypothetical protein HDU96_010869 [Phlyctochytrium bullatum]|nr:hypothetical protein HDU96_010869 [Phlyctochytrium bullatum]